MDDNAMVLYTMLLVLEKHGYSVQGAINSSDALQKAQAFQPQIIITDVHLPDKNGVETAMLIHELLPDAHILLMSGDTGAAPILAEARRRGMEFDVLPKPTEPAKLLAKLQSLVH